MRHMQLDQADMPWMEALVSPFGICRDLRDIKAHRFHIQYLEPVGRTGRPSLLVRNVIVLAASAP
jgi:hypothetical protein